MSTFDLLAAYLRQRTRARVLIPLALVLASFGWWLEPSGGFHVSAFFAAALRAFVFTLAFRVWDDLEDRGVDRILHPERVLASTSRVAPFMALILGLWAVGTTLLFPLSDLLPRVVALGIAGVTLSAWYASRRSENWNRVAGGLIVLVKYPLIAYAVAPALPTVTSARTVIVLAVLYALICVYEYADDPELRHVISSRRSLP